MEEHERRESALREATDSTDQEVEHEEEAAYKYREYRCGVLCRLLLNIFNTACLPVSLAGQTILGGKTPPENRLARETIFQSASSMIQQTVALYSVLVSVVYCTRCDKICRLIDCSSPSTPPSHPPPPRSPSGDHVIQESTYSFTVRDKCLPGPPVTLRRRQSSLLNYLGQKVTSSSVKRLLLCQLEEGRSGTSRL